MHGHSSTNVRVTGEIKIKFKILDSMIKYKLLRFLTLTLDGRIYTGQSERRVLDAKRVDDLSPAIPE